MKIKELNNENKPRERLITNGPNHLSDIELLAIILGSGTKTNDVFELSSNILKKYNFNELKNITYSDLIKINGIKQAKACKLLACFEIAKRANKNTNNNHIFFSLVAIFYTSIFSFVLTDAPFF